MTDWEVRARGRLVDAEIELSLAELMGSEALPAWPCTLPWSRLELSTRRFLGPCCPDYQSRPASAPPVFDLEADWNGATMRAFRRALTGASSLESTCATTCPTLAGGRHPPAAFRLRGGRAPFVAHQLAIARAMLEGAERVPGPPLDLMFAPTNFCNYDCLMCEWGEEGTRESDLPDAFYASLEPALDRIRTLEVAGGEPLAASAFRSFLTGLDRRRFPDLQISLVTNGSYLLPKELERWSAVPFSTLTISLNAASAATYRRVNRGLDWSRIRENLEALAARRRDGRWRASSTYSMVLLRSNVHEIVDFARLAEEDGAGVRFMLPMFDRNGESIMTAAAPMESARDQLRLVVRRLRDRGQEGRARGVEGELAVLEERLAARVFEPLPDGRADPRHPRSLLR